MQPAAEHIKPLIQTQKSTAKWMGYLGLATGMILLLVAVQMFFNINLLMRSEAPKKSGTFDFVSISKIVTNENMGRDNRFTKADIEELVAREEIEAVAPLYSNQFSARASAGNLLPFGTELFLESLDTSFLDVTPADFKWSPGDRFVPLILSADFLELYNVFAPSQGLPQVSAATVASVNILLECSGPLSGMNFRAGVVGLSDRVNSVLVPESFLQWANKTLSGNHDNLVSRLYLKTPDVNNPSLINFLNKKEYHINKDKIRFGRIKGMLQSAFAAIGSFGILMLILALALFGFYLRLMIERSKENLNLLLKLGYSPSWLSKTFSRTLVPVYIIVVCIAIFTASAAQFAFSRLAFAEGALSLFLHPVVWLTAFILSLLIIWFNTRMVSKEIARLDAPA